MSAAGKWDSVPPEKEPEEQLWVGSRAVLYTIKQNCPHLSKSRIIYICTQLVISWQKTERNQNCVSKIRCIKSAKRDGEKISLCFRRRQWLEKAAAARLSDSITKIVSLSFLCLCLSCNSATRWHHNHQLQMSNILNDQSHTCTGQI